MNAPEIIAPPRSRRAGKLERRATEIATMYYDRNMTQVEIAQAVNCTQRAVLLFMRRHGMKARPQIKRDQRAERNSTWRGDSISYKGAHNRVAAQRGRPKLCEDCGSADPEKRYEWANVSGRYHDPNDYRRLCRSCHCKADRLIRNLGAYAKGASQ